jgi:predicted nucleic acid-binding protein
LSKFYNVQTATVVLKIFTTRLNVIFSEPFIKWGLIVSDPDDNKFVDLAISSYSNYLVTNDHHFDVLNQLDFPSIKVVTLNEFQILMGY